ncbi:hypothetical protein J4E85_010377 [Alternaria conjuncta]|uniref:uncharacterized protein n=1 Tax=Alternaria conjuncta TaxID=181017 RepID=UPI002220EF33|nr:uncharacterized protein J4E85_010377 [Alternaria conjuncta]KAI4915253.1 hypothetical protein J4E85_010377 [Alternaria conjuncta]
MPPSKTNQLTPKQLADFRKGPKANIVIGPDDNRYIGLESASVNLLAHFSPVARKKLIEERATVLTIPDGSKNAIRWIYKYMQAGERDPMDTDTFEALNSDALITMYKHCELLEYDSLKKRIFNRLKSKFYHSLPTIDEIKQYQNAIPALYDCVIRCIVDEMARPWTCDYEPYQELANTNEAFGKALDGALQKYIASRVKVSEDYYRTTKDRRVIWAINYIEDIRAGRRPYIKFADRSSNMLSWKPQQKGKGASGLFNNVKADANGIAGNIPALAAKQDKKYVSKTYTPFTCHKCGDEGHIARNCTTATAAESVTGTAFTYKKPSQRLGPICYTCKGTGHLSRNCPAEQSAAKPAIITGLLSKATDKRPQPVCYECGEEGHIARNCPEEKPQSERSKAKSQQPFICYNCGGEGHMARECTEDVPSSELADLSFSAFPALPPTKTSTSGGKMVNGLRPALGPARAAAAADLGVNQANAIDESEEGEGSNSPDHEVR